MKEGAQARTNPECFNDDQGEGHYCTIIVATTSLGRDIWCASGTVSPVGQLKRPLLRLYLSMALIASSPDYRTMWPEKHARES